MPKEGYWDYMSRKLREDHIKEMQKSLDDCYERIIELNDEIYKLKESKFVFRQHGNAELYRSG